MSQTPLLTASVTNVASPAFPLDVRAGRVGIQVVGAGGWVGTLNLEATVDGVGWDPVQGEKASDGTKVTSLTTSDIVFIPTGGLKALRVRQSNWAAGNVSATAYWARGAG